MNRAWIDACDELNSFVAAAESHSWWRQCHDERISQNVLEEILKAYAAWEQPPSPQAMGRRDGPNDSYDALIRGHFQTLHAGSRLDQDSEIAVIAARKFTHIRTHSCLGGFKRNAL